MKKISVLSFVLFFNVFLINGQSDLYVQGKVVEEKSGHVIRATISSVAGQEYTLTNKEGLFSFRPNILMDTLWRVDAIGYLPYKGKIDSIVYLAACDIIEEIPEISAKSLVENALNALEKNFGKHNLFYYGFFTETTYEGKNLSSFAEGIVQSFKGPYTNGFGFDHCFEALKNESSIMIKGNRRSNFLENNALLPSEKGYLLPKTYDPLSICSSPLNKENIDYFTFRYEHTLAETPESIYKIKFTNEASGISGSIYIGMETFGIYRVEVSEDMSIETLEPAINEIQSGYTVDYTNKDGIFNLSSIFHSQILVKANAPDTIIIESDYITTRNPIKIDSLPPKSEILARNQSAEPFLSIYPHQRFSATQIILRTAEVTDKIGEGEEIQFENVDLDDVIRISQEDANLIFLYIYAENDIPSKQMEERTFQNQEVVSYLNRHFTCSAFNIEEAEDNGILYKAELEFLPSFIIMTPLGQIIQIFDGFMLPLQLLEILKSYADFDVYKLFYAYDKRKGSDNKKIKSAYLDLFRQLRDMDHPEAINFVQFFEDETNNWETTEAKNVIFQYLIPSNEKKYNEIFLKNIPYYERLYGKEKVGDLLYNVAYQRVLDKDINKYQEFEKYLQKNAPAYADSLYAYFLIEYFSRIKINKHSYIVAVLEYLDDYHSDNWPIASRHLMTVGINTDEHAVINRCMDILKYYEGKVTDYEYLDIYALFLYKSGKEQEALQLVNEIKSLANKKGINYEVALRILASKNKQE